MRELDAAYDLREQRPPLRGAADTPGRYADAGC